MTTPIVCAALGPDRTTRLVRLATISTFVAVGSRLAFALMASLTRVFGFRLAPVIGTAISVVALSLAAWALRTLKNPECHPLAVRIILTVAVGSTVLLIASSAATAWALG